MKVYGSFLFARNTVFHGNVQAEPGHGRVVLGFRQDEEDETGNTVEGDVQIKGGVGPQFSIVRGATVEGDVLLEENANGQAVLDSVIGGNIQVFKNFWVISPAFLTSASIGGNTVGGNLQCKENNPVYPPIVSPSAGSNTVAGNKEDQCSVGF